MLTTFLGSQQNLNKNSITELSQTLIEFKLNLGTLTWSKVYNDDYDTIMNSKTPGCYDPPPLKKSCPEL
jgi:hypothetical protein